MSDSVSQEKKLALSLKNTVLFVLVSLPFTYKLVNKLFMGSVNICNADGCPTIAGLAIHSVVFFLLVYISMQITY